MRSHMLEAGSPLLGTQLALGRGLTVSPYWHWHYAPTVCWAFTRFPTDGNYFPLPRAPPLQWVLDLKTFALNIILFNIINCKLKEVKLDEKITIYCDEIWNVIKMSQIYMWDMCTFDMSKLNCTISSTKLRFCKRNCDIQQIHFPAHSLIIIVIYLWYIILQKTAPFFKIKPFKIFEKMCGSRKPSSNPLSSDICQIPEDCAWQEIQFNTITRLLSHQYQIITGPPIKSYIISNQLSRVTTLPPGSRSVKN